MWCYKLISLFHAEDIQGNEVVTDAPLKASSEDTSHIDPLDLLLVPRIQVRKVESINHRNRISICVSHFFNTQNNLKR